MGSEAGGAGEDREREKLRRMMESRHRQVQRVEQFVRRGRRIAAHSLAQDRRALELAMRLPMRIEPRTLEKPPTMIIELWPEEAVESAAARVRPLTLEKDGISLPAVVDSLASLVRGTGVKLDKAALKDGWAQRTNPDVGSGVKTRTFDPKSGTYSPMLDGSELAKAWFYGEAVHHDVSHQYKTVHLSRELVYAHGTALVAFIMVRALDLLDAITDLKERGHLDDVSDMMWTEPVVVETGQCIVELSAMWTPHVESASTIDGS